MLTRACRALFVLFLTGATGPAWASRDDLLGAWRFDDGSIVTLAPSAEGTWRYRQLEDGRSGRLHPAEDVWQAGPGFTDREPVALRVRHAGERLHWSPVGGSPRQAERIRVQTRDLEWRSGGVTLRGQLVLPDAAGPHPVVLLVHGSERLPAVGQWHDPYMLAAHGIAGFVYDKRGTGRSEGEFSADFDLLAEDAAGAARLLATLPEVDRQRIGFAGFSQGGWVAPLAASKFGAAKAVLVGYGMVDSPLHEDRWQCLRAVRASGGGPDELAQADQLVDATHQLLTSNLREGWPAFKAVLKRNRHQPWFQQLEASACIGASFADYPAWIVRSFAGRRLPPDIDWRYDSHALLAASSTPMLWLLAADDTQAASADTEAAVRRLAAAGKPYEVVMLAGAEHGMLLLRPGSNPPEPTGYHPEYFARTLAFWQQQLR